MPELRHVRSVQQARFDGGGELASVARLLPVVAEDVRARELLDCDLGLPRAVGAHQAHVLPRLQRTRGEEHLTSRRHGDKELGSERLIARRGSAADALRDRRRARGVEVPDERRPPPRRERPRRRLAVDTGADHSRRLRVRTAERLRREHGSRAGPYGGHRRCVEHREEASVLRRRDEHDSHHCRESLRGVAGERRDPLEQRMTGAERRHRAEVACRIGGHVHLRRHRPLTARVRDERIPHCIDGALRRNRVANVLRGEERNHGAP